MRGQPTATKVWRGKNLPAGTPGRPGRSRSGAESRDVPTAPAVLIRQPKDEGGRKPAGAALCGDVRLAAAAGWRAGAVGLGLASGRAQPLTRMKEPSSSARRSEASIARKGCSRSTECLLAGIRTGPDLAAAPLDRRLRAGPAALRAHVTDGLQPAAATEDVFNSENRKVSLALREFLALRNPRSPLALRRRGTFAYL